MKEVKWVKRILKNKLKITQTLLIAFFINGNIIAYSEEYFDLNNGQIINQNNFNYDILESQVYKGDITSQINKFRSGNGLSLSAENTEDTIIKGNISNNGGILGNAKILSPDDQAYTRSVGNGISLDRTYYNKDYQILLGLNNAGIIKGDITTYAGTLEMTDTSSQAGSDSAPEKSGNGINIFSENVSVKSSSNSGIISGKLFSKSGISKNGIQPSASKYSGNGISATSFSADVDSLTDSAIDSFINFGIIRGEGVLESNKTHSNLANNYEQKNMIRSTASGNGISNYTLSKSNTRLFSQAILNNIKNTGLISGSITATGEVDENKVGTNNKSINPSYTYASGNGISNYITTSGNINNIAKISQLNNQGILKGEVFGVGGTSNSQTHNEVQAYVNSSGNGISSMSSTNNTEAKSIIEDISNSGLISGFSSVKTGIVKPTANGKVWSYAWADGSGNGILSHSSKNYKNEITSLKNTGTISGYSKVESTEYQTQNKPSELLKDYEKNEFSGNGIAVSGTLNSVSNSGVIKGSESAIAAKTIDTVNNFGIFAGKEIFGDGIELVKNNSSKDEKKLMQIAPTTENNFGIYVKLSNDLNREVLSITNGKGGEVKLEDGTTKFVINGQTYTEAGIKTEKETEAKDSYIISRGEYKNNIINGAGINKGALIVNNTTSIDNSIVNGYNTAVYLENSSQLTATNTSFNGGGLKNDIAVIKGSTKDNVASILGTSIINGSVDLNDGDDKLTISNSVQINGDLNGGLGKDILNLGESSIAKASSNLNMLHNITGFENINTNGNITLFETAKITGADKISLESGNLVLRVDPTVTENGKVTGHALYGNNGTLTSSGGNLVVSLNGLGKNTTISMGGTTITLNTNDNWWKDTDYIKTNSLVLDGKLSADGKDINITVLESIPLEPSNPAPIVVDSLLYEKLNKIYQSIVSAAEIGNLANTTLLENKTYNESLGGLLTILDQMYSNTPYAYTVKSSRDSLKLFEDNMSYLTIKPKKDEMIVQGKAIYTGVKNDSGAYGKNYYGFDTGHRNYKTTTNTIGGLATFEYGLSDKTSVGVVLGGNNQDINFKGSSKIKGNSLYLGTFAKTDINNFKFMGGVGYQYTSADADRKVSNRYDSFSTGDKYDINSLNAFVEAKYIYNAEQDWTLEPKVRLSYYYIDQDKVNEGYIPRQISMKADKVNSNTADVEIGIDFVKSLYLNSGKLKNILSLGVINTIGDKSKELNGYILGKEKDGKKFDIQGVELPKTSGKVSYNLELEQTNGMIYTAGVSLEFAKDYNRNINAAVGIGYKF